MQYGPPGKAGIAELHWLLLGWKCSPSGRLLGYLSAPVILETILYTTGNPFSFVENFAGPLTFKFGVFFFHLLLICITSYQIISLSSGNWLPGAHSYMTIVLSVAKSYHGHSQQNWAGLRAAHRDTAHWWPRNHLVITESEI